MIGALTLVVVAYVISTNLYNEVIVGQTLQRDLGFTLGSACIGLPADPSGYIRCPAIDSVTSRGIFERAGVRASDVISDYSAADLFKRLQRRRGGMAEIAAVDGSRGPNFRYRPGRMIQFEVPPRGGRRNGD